MTATPRNRSTASPSPKGLDGPDFADLLTDDPTSPEDADQGGGAGGLDGPVRVNSCPVSVVDPAPERHR
jgi:hypothetical protein